MARRAATSALRAGLTAALAALALASPASAAPFGTTPIPISVGPNGEAADGPSGGASISGDDRAGRLVAFHSEATNLVAGDANGASDVFLWSRPRGRAGLTLDRPARPAGSLIRVSLGAGGREANGPSREPSVDGSVQRRPHCVAFTSEATNLASGDADRTADVFVRDLSARRTVLVSRGIRPAAGDPSIDGSCRQVAFEAGGRVYLARVTGGKPRSLGAGRDPDVSLDGSAVAWQRGAGIVARVAGRTLQVSPGGANPSISDRETDIWGVAFDSSRRLARGDRNNTTDSYLKVLTARAPRRGYDLLSASRRGGDSLGGQSSNGGVTAYAARRGIVTFTTTFAGGSILYYRNNNSGNIDDLAAAETDGARPAITEVSTSARANFVAFSSTGARFPFDGNGSVQDVFFKHLIDGDAL